MKRKSTLWTHYEITRLRQLVSEGATSAEIGKILDRSTFSVNSKRQRLRILVKGDILLMHDPKIVAQVLKFKLLGWSNGEVGKAFGIHENNISKFINRIGFTHRFRAARACINPYQRWTDFELHRLRKYLKKGYSLERIHTYYPNRTFRAVFQKAREIARHWGTPKARAERAAWYKRAREKQLRVY